MDGTPIQKCLSEAAPKKYRTRHWIMESTLRASNFWTTEKDNAQYCNAATFGIRKLCVIFLWCKRFISCSKLTSVYWFLILMACANFTEENYRSTLKLNNSLSNYGSKKINSGWTKFLYCFQKLFFSEGPSKNVRWEEQGTTSTLLQQQ